jgi:hypothetical protein
MGEVVLGLDPGLSQTRFNVQLLRRQWVDIQYMPRSIYKWLTEKKE